MLLIAFLIKDRPNKALYFFECHSQTSITISFEPFSSDLQNFCLTRDKWDFKGTEHVRQLLKNSLEAYIM